MEECTCWAKSNFHVPQKAAVAAESKTVLLHEKEVVKPEVWPAM